MMRPPPLSRSASRCRCPLALVIAAAAALACAEASAQTLTWDANTTTTGAQDGSGTWNLSSPNWWDGTQDDLWSNTVPDSAVFGAGTAGGTVTLGANIIVGNLTFNTTAGTYTIAGATGDTLTLSNTTINGGGNAIISANLAGTGGFTVTNTGSTTAINVIALAGNNSALSGSILVSGSSGTTGPVDLRIDSATAIGGISQITVNSGSALVVNVASPTLGAGTTMTIVGTGLNSGGPLQGNSGINVTWAGNVVLGASGARISGGSSGTLNVNGVISEAVAGSSVLFSRLAGSTTVLNAVNTYTGDTQIYGGSTTGQTATLKIGVNNAINAASDLSILATAATGLEALDLNGNVLTLRGLDTSGNQLSAFQELSIVNNGASPSVLTIGDATTTNTRIFSGAINNGTGGMSLVKINGNTQILIGNSGYTGATTVDAGTLQLGSSLATGTTGSAGSNGAMASLSYLLNGGTFVINNTGANNNSAARISDSAVFTLNGGTFLYQGSDQASTNSSETIATITFGSSAPSTSPSGTGYSTFTVQFNSTNTAAVTAGQLTRTAGEAIAIVNGVNLGESSTSASSAAFIFLTNAPTLVGTTAALPTGINTAATNTQIVPYLLGEVSTSTGLGTATGVPNTFVTYNAATGLRPLSLSEFATSISSGNNVYLTAAGSSNTTNAINSLIMGGTSTLSIGSGVLTDSSGALLLESSGGISGGGTLDFGSAEGVITVTSGIIAQIATKVTGTQGFTVFGSGVLALDASSVFTGNVTLRGATTVPQLSSTQNGSGVVTAGPFGLGTLVFAGGQIRGTTTSNISIGNTVILQANTTFPASSTDSLTFSGGVTIASGTPTLTNNSAGALIFSGAIGDSGQTLGLTFAGTGTTTLSGQSSYTGGTTINSGAVIVSGSLSASGAVTVGNSASLSTSATLGGSGTVGNVTAVGSGSPSTSGATIDPGNTPGVAGILKTGSLSATNGAHLSLQIGGNTTGGETTTGYDQIVASGAVTLTGGDLKLALLGSPTFSTSDELFLIINNSGLPANGAFGSVTLNGSAVNPSDIVLGNQQFQLVYNANYSGPGSDGIANDVALMAIVPEPSSSWMLLGGLALSSLLYRPRRSASVR